MATAVGAGSTDDPTGSDTPSIEGYLSNTGNDDRVVDETGAAEVTVAVGSEANGDNFGFAPPAARVATGTTVVWR